MTTATHHNSDSAAEACAEASKLEQLDHILCEQWAGWVHTRKFYGPPPTLGVNLLAKLQRRRSAVTATEGGPDAACSALLMALNAAVSAKPLDGGRIVFELFYRHRVRNVKRAAEELHISRSAWYRRLSSFRRCVVAEAYRLIAVNAEHQRAGQQRIAMPDDEEMAA